MPRKPNYHKYEQILACLMDGVEHREIQSKLKVSPNTIQNAIKWDSGGRYETPLVSGVKNKGLGKESNNDNDNDNDNMPNNTDDGITNKNIYRSEYVLVNIEILRELKVLLANKKYKNKIITLQQKIIVKTLEGYIENAEM